MPPAAAQGGAKAATTVGWEALRELAGFWTETGCAISFYLDLDPHVTPTAADLDTRTRALLDEAHKRAEAGGDRRTHEQQASVRSGLERIQRFFESEFTREGVRSVAVFVAPADGLFRPLLLTAPVEDCVKIANELYLTPLVPQASGPNGTIVAFVGRERGDVYELCDGRLEPVASRFEGQPRRHDQGGWSQARLQRHVDELAERHLRGVAEELDRQLRRRRHAQLVLAGAEEMRSEFLSLLTSHVRAAIAGWANAEAHAGASELLASVKPVLERKRGEQEAQLVARWHDALGQGARATAGWAATVEAADDARVDVLLYAAGANQALWRCRQCKRLQSEDGGCPLDGTELEHCAEGLDLLVHKVLERGGTVCAVTAMRDLDPVGGLGAVLRF